MSLEAYSQAARNMGLGLNFDCKAEARPSWRAPKGRGSSGVPHAVHAVLGCEDTVLLPEAPLAQAFAPST